MPVQVDVNSGEIGGLLGIWLCWVAHEAFFGAADGMIGVAVEGHPRPSPCTTQVTVEEIVTWGNCYS